MNRFRDLYDLEMALSALGVEVVPACTPYDLCAFLPGDLHPERVMLICGPWVRRIYDDTGERIGLLAYRGRGWAKRMAQDVAAWLRRER